MNIMLADLLLAIDDYLSSKISLTELEQYSLKLIGNDRFDNLDNELQNVIHTLGSKEFNNFDVDDITNIRNTVARYFVLNTDSSEQDNRWHAEIKNFCQLWITHVKEGLTNQDNNAQELMTALVHEHPATAITMMDIVTQSTDNRAVLANLGAGPLEDLLGSDNGQAYLQEILDHARQGKNWRFALGCVWTGGFTNRQLASELEEVIAQYFPEGRP